MLWLCSFAKPFLFVFEVFSSCVDNQKRYQFDKHNARKRDTQNAVYRVEIVNDFAKSEEAQRVADDKAKHDDN